MQNEERKRIERNMKHNFIKFAVILYNINNTQLEQTIFIYITDCPLTFCQLVEWLIIDTKHFQQNIYMQSISSQTAI